MPERERRLLEVLRGLDERQLERCACYLAGGTRIALSHGSFRVSYDIDFVCADAEGYAELRTTVRSLGYRALFKGEALARLGLPRDPRMDQYGVRFPVVVDGEVVRVELIREGRIALGAPEHVGWTSVPCLSIVDCFAEKLLANSDRWADRDSLARDLVDLAMLRAEHGPIPEHAFRVVEAAYRDAPREDLRKAIDAFLADDAFRTRCFEGLQVTDPAKVLEGLRRLSAEV